MCKSKFSRFIKLVLVAVLAVGSFSLVGCGKSGSETCDTDKYSAVEKSGLTSKTIKVPAYFFEADKRSEEDIAKDFEEQGIKNYEKNEDGSYSITMSASEYDQMIDDLYKTTCEYLDGLKGNEDFPNVEDVTYDKDFNEVVITLSTTEASFQESFLPYTAGFVPAYYQSLAGLPVKSEIIMRGSDEQVIDKVVIPQDFEDTAQDAQE